MSVCILYITCYREGLGLGERLAFSDQWLGKIPVEAMPDHRKKLCEGPEEVLNRGTNKCKGLKEAW